MSSKRDLERNRRMLRALEKKRAAEEAEADVYVPPDPLTFPYVKWLKNNMMIRKKGAGRVPFTDWWPEQRRLAAKIIKSIKLRKPIKFVICKSRQQGITTIVEAFLFLMARLVAECSGLLIADTKEKAELIFQNISWWHEDLPEEEKKLIPLKGKRTNTQHFKYGTPHRSELVVTTGDRAGAGLMLCFIHVSEAAFVQNFDSKLAALLPAMPDASVTPLTIVIVESTPNGKNDFYQLCEQAKKEESEWELIFIGWKDDPNARLSLEPGEVLDLDEDEREFQQEHGLDDEQMKWVHKTLTDKCFSVWEVFHQEYPISYEIAFQYSGFPVFARKKIAADIKLITVPEFVGNLVFLTENTPVVVTAEDRHGPLSIVEFVQPEARYCIGADISFGLGIDYTVAYVIRIDTKWVVAQYRGNRIEPTDVAADLHRLGAYYNFAFLGVENNGPGHTTLTTLRDGHHAFPQTKNGYPNLYYTIRTDKRSDEQTKVLGFSTSKKTKDNAITDLKGAYNAGYLGVPFYDLLWEMDGFAQDIVTRKFKQNNQDAKTRVPHDDCIMAFAIANQMRYVSSETKYCPAPKVVYL